MIQHTDNQGFDNLIIVGYWRDPAVHERWLSRPEVADWWNSDERLSAPIGFFREIVSPRADQFETLYAFTEDFPGVGAIMDGVSDEIEEHAYWGSARDRFPKSQVDRMTADGVLQAESDPQSTGRVRVRAHDNICLIRSGQDWADAGEEERKLYLEEVEPVLRQGMYFLRDNGEDLGCYSTVTDTCSTSIWTATRSISPTTSGTGARWTSWSAGPPGALDLLERWAESHPTHLRIFTTFFRVVTSLEKLELYHEVSTFDAADQFYEYVNRHPATDMLRDAKIASVTA